jgi:peptidoglycan hydrolase-like protein with peptidoglycan-binding domain
MKNNYLIGFLVLTVVVLGYFVLKGGNATTEEQNQTSAAATAKLETYSNATTAQPIQKATTIDQPPINYTFTKTLASGMKSDEVTKLQQVLAENVYYEGEITGVMDKLTVQELKDFQTDNGLEVTGTTGPKLAHFSLNFLDTMALVPVVSQLFVYESQMVEKCIKQGNRSLFVGGLAIIHYQ